MHDKLLIENSAFAKEVEFFDLQNFPVKSKRIYAIRFVTCS